MSAVLDGTSLMDADVAALGGNSGLIGTQESGKSSRVDLGAAYQKMNIGLRRGTERTDGVRRLGAESVAAIAGAAHIIYLSQSLPYRRVGSGTVIVTKVDHTLYLVVSQVSTAVYHWMGEKTTRESQAETFPVDPAADLGYNENREI